MTLNDVEKINYINNQYHQYFDFTINKNLTTTEKINLVIPIKSLYSISNANEVLHKYNDTDIEKEKIVYCSRVIDGDTICVKDVIDYEDNNGIITKKTFTSLDDYPKDKITLDKEYRVRFVGVDTPEITSENSNSLLFKKGKTAANFVEQICLHKFIHLNIDNERDTDDYGRTLAVVIVDNKNLNEVLLKENFATVMSIPPSEFDPNDWEDNSSESSLFNENNQDISILSPYFNADMNNIVFTPSHDTNTLYKYEIYKGVIYLKLNPFSQNIRMHILPKAYDCSNPNAVLILKDSDLNKRSITNSSNYKIYTEKDNINAYFQENGKDRDRNNISNKLYNKNNWAESPANISKTFVDFSYDISQDTKGFNNLQICCGYRYNNTSPYYALHYTGVKDNQGALEDRCTLIDANIDKIKGNKTHIISQMAYNNNGVYIEHDPKIRKEIGSTDHTTTIGTLYHKTLKYINDSLYVEELDNYGVQEWIDRKEEEGRS